MKPFQMGRCCCSVRFRVYWLAYVSIWRSIYSPHTSEMPLSIEWYINSRPQDYYPFPWPTSYTIATCGMNRGHVLTWEAYPSLGWLQHNNWTASVVLTAWWSTSLHSMASSFLVKLGWHHQYDRTVIVDCDNLMQCDHMPPWHPEGPDLEWPQNFRYLLINGSFILCGEEQPLFTLFWILEPLLGEFWWSVGSIK